MGQVIIIIYGDKEKTCLELNQAFDYELDDWPLASRRTWVWDDEGEIEATEYMKELAIENGLSFVEEGQDYLD